MMAQQRNLPQKTYVRDDADAWRSVEDNRRWWAWGCTEPARNDDEEKVRTRRDFFYKLSEKDKLLRVPAGGAEDAEDQLGHRQDSQGASREELQGRVGLQAGGTEVDAAEG